MIDIEMLKILGIYVVKRAYFHLIPGPQFMMEAHIFIMPLRIPHVLEVMGVIGDARYVAVQRKAGAEKTAKALEERSRLQDKAGQCGLNPV